MDSVYELYRRGCELLDHGDYHAAIVPLDPRARPRARQGLDPRGARPRAVPRAALRGAPPPSSGALAAQAPTNDYALFCLGRAMQLLGRHREACHPLALACSLRPEREDYRLYRDRARARRPQLTEPYADAMLDSTAFVPAGRRRLVVPKVGARPLFLCQEAP